MHPTTGATRIAATALVALLALSACDSSGSGNQVEHFALEIGHEDCGGVPGSVEPELSSIQRDDIVSVSRFEPPDGWWYEYGLILELTSEKADEVAALAGGFALHDGFRLVVGAASHCGMLTTATSAAAINGWALIPTDSWDGDVYQENYQELLLLYDLDDHGYAEVLLDEPTVVGILERIEGILSR